MFHHLTQLKLKRELQHPCLRKLVLLKHSLRHNYPTQQSYQQLQSQAEFNWFQHIMDEIDDSDNESEHNNHSIIKRARSADIHQSNQIFHPNKRTRLPPVSISYTTAQKRISKCHRKKSSTHSDSIPYWGFITTKLDPIIHHPSNSSIHTNDDDDEDQQSSLPSLLPTKSSYLFHSTHNGDSELIIDPSNHNNHIQDHKPRIALDLSTHATRSLHDVQLNSIDFSPYDFLISTTNNTQDHSILQVKYLIGNLGKRINRHHYFHSSHTRQNIKNNLKSSHLNRDNMCIKIGKHEKTHFHHHHPSISNSLIVKKFHVVFNHLLDVNLLNSDLNYYHHHHSHSHLSFDHLPPYSSLFHPQPPTFAWKVYGLHHS